MQLDTNNEQQTEEDVGELNAESYSVKKDTRGEPLRLKDVARVTLIDALMVEIVWALWRTLLLLIGFASLVQAIVVVMVFVDVYLLRKNVRKQTVSPAKKTEYTEYDDDSSELADDSGQDSHNRY